MSQRSRSDGPTMKRYVTENDISWQKIMERVSELTSGDEDFDVFKCSNCASIYLEEYEAGTVFLDPKSLKTQNLGADFSCPRCGFLFPCGEALIGEKAQEKYKVEYHELTQSGWSWILK